MTLGETRRSVPTGSEGCKHDQRPWAHDPLGNHWCQDCNLWHDFPHEADQDPKVCVER